MTKKLLLVFCISAMGFTAFSQQGTTETVIITTEGDSIPVKEMESNTSINSEVTTAVISTTDTTQPLSAYDDQMAQWKSGKAKYPPRPKDVWEVGIHLGNYFIDGDVDPRLPIPGCGYGVHVRKAINYTFSIRMDAFYGMARGLETQPYGDALEAEQDIYEGYGASNPWFPAYRTDYYYLALQGVLNIGNILFHKDRNKWNTYLFVGVGADHNCTKLDLRDDNGNYYNNLVAKTGWSYDKFNTRQGRVDIKKALKDEYDGVYDTKAKQKGGIFRIGDEFNIHTVFIGGVGVSRKINNRFNIALEHQVHVTDNDYLDGQAWRTRTDQTRQDDIQHYTDLRLGINLGNLKKRKEPLYWLNPLDAAFSDIAELKQRPKFDLSDSDQDGVIDLLDQEPETPAGSPVDTRGITLDSDNDGIADYKDEEPYSPPGYQVSEKGVAQVPVQPKLTEADVNKLIDQKLGIPGSGPGGSGSGAGGGTLGGGSLLDWFLPMIHFNLDEYCVKNQYYPQLQAVAEVMQTHPNLTVTAYGHTDIRNTNAYNNVLSFNRAKAAIEHLVSKYNIPRERFKLMYGGEESPLAGNASNHYMNRRVEFRVAKSTDQDMSRPEGPEAGDCHKKRIRKTKAPGNVQTDDGTEKDKKSGY